MTLIDCEAYDRYHLVKFQRIATSLLCSFCSFSLHLVLLFYYFARSLSRQINFFSFQCSTNFLLLFFPSSCSSSLSSSIPSRHPLCQCACVFACLSSPPPFRLFVASSSYAFLTLLSSSAPPSSFFLLLRLLLEAGMWDDGLFLLFSASAAI